jgi:Alr-MurF fusion protein
MKYTINKVTDIVQGKLLQRSKGDDAIKNIVLDSRKISEPEESIFFAIKGKRHDGHRFINDLYEKGIRHFVVSEKVDVMKLKDASVIEVKNSVRALQQLAAFHRKQFQIPVIGITGSNGKTITKEWLYQLLHDDFNIVRSPKSYNSQVGVPLSMWQMNAENTLGVFEAGISEPDEMEHLEKVMQPALGIFTNIGDAHAEGFLNIRHKIKEKLRLFSNVKVLIYRKDYAAISECIADIKKQLLSHEDEAEEKFPLFTWSTQNEADFEIKKIEKHTINTLIEGTYKGKKYAVEIPFIDDASIENAINCWAALIYLKVPHEKIKERMKKLGRIAMRLELKEAMNNCALINDSYNSDIASLSIALDFLNQQTQHPRKTVILSDILQSGKPDQELYDEVSKKISQKGIQHFIGIGKNISRQHKMFENIPHLETSFYNSTADFLEHFAEQDFEDETILLKGARSFEFEAISKLLEEKRHATVLEINLNALIHNLNEYHKLLKPGVKMMAMVKASSYGSGGYEIAKALQFNRIDYLGVAYADEGVDLRKSGITVPIMVMNPEERSFETMINYRLEPNIYSLRLLKKFIRAFNSFKKNSEHHDFPIHIELETGMNRLGFAEEDISELKTLLAENVHLKIQSVFSHLAASEDAKEDEFTEKQIAQYEKISNALMKELSYKPLRHILNSAGIARFPKAHFDMVRLGLGLYGIDSSHIPQLHLQQVGRLKATISQIKYLRKGETIGYNRSFKAKKNMRIATVSIGYADGIDRRLSNGIGSMLVNGKPAPVVGKVCMDMTMLDISDIEHVREGDDVLIFGEQLPITQVAQWAGTIPYEILTGISARVQKIFYQE